MLLMCMTYMFVHYIFMLYDDVMLYIIPLPFNISPHHSQSFTHRGLELVLNVRLISHSAGCLLFNGLDLFYYYLLSVFDKIIGVWY